MNDKVKIPAEILRGLDAVRHTGRTNMFDRPAVAAIALELGYVDAAFWLEDEVNHTAYATGIFKGFTEKENPTP